MRKIRLFMSAFIVFVILVSLCPAVFAKPKDSEIPPPPPTDPWNYETVEPTSVSTADPACRRAIPPPEGDKWYWVGASTTLGTDGIMVRLTVADPLVPHDGSKDFFCARILVTDPETLAWFEIGWIEDANDTEDRQHIYVENSSKKSYFDQFPISAGMNIWVSLTHDKNYWTAWLRWDGAWRALKTEHKPFSRAPIAEQMGEVWISAKYDNLGHWIIIPRTYFYGAELYNEVLGQWRLWDKTFQDSTTTRYDPLYYAHWNAEYYDWYMYWYRD